MTSNLLPHKQFRFKAQIGAAYRAGIAVLLAVALTGCMSMELDDLGDPSPEIPSKLIGEMAKKGTRPDSAVLVRIFKQESELEVWKQSKTGEYALLKTYPMCRWSGKLGPKTKDGDRQAPEGFYHVSSGMLNPKSQYYLSFNLGYPNRLESALGYTGEALMVHGACSSSGCYALTDQGVGEIYAVVQRALAGGQERFQVQAYPFRMTAENLARHKTDPNFGFWKNVKQGYDIFEATKRQPKVSVCGGKYVFNTEFEDGEPKDPLAVCPAAKMTPDAGLLAKLQEQEKKLADLLAESTSVPVNAYVDGGMHPNFRALLKKNGPEKLAEKISTIKYPISRPDAALADPYGG
ncbi:hypothetical protein ACFHWW_26830 [Ensifer sp. P24N7]|uniref:hypothetical protein n=1 Tax=Sinorhizobium sp. P24N7 TaxID=3348358 RepID=UPI0035F4C81A